MSAWRTRFAIVSTLGIVAVGLLAAAFLAASARDRRARASIERMHDRAALSNAERAVAARAREIVLRESARPFYVYSHYYIPPDLLTISDAIAVSTLADEHPRAPMVGWFQVDPDGTVRTPLTPAPSETPVGLEARLVDVARSPAVQALRASIADRAAGELVARARAAEPTTQTVSVLVAANDEPASVPLPVALNLQANVLASDIQRAQAGDPASFQRASASNSAPVVAQILQQSFAPEPQQAPPQRQAAAVPRVAPPPSEAALAPEPPRRLVRRTRVVTMPPAPTAPPSVPAETAVHYEPMRWLDVAGDAPFVLARIVSSLAHAGDDASAVVQAAVVDRAALLAVLRDAARGASSEGRTVEVVASPARRRDCALVRTNASLPKGVSLCLRRPDREALAAVQSRSSRSDVLVVTALVSVVLLSLVLLAGVARREAELAERRRDFVSAVSHELRTPLTTLRMHAEMLREGMVDDARRPRVHDELVRETNRMSRLVENVLEVARLEAGKRVVSKTEADLHTVLARVVDDHADAASAQGMRLALAMEGPLRAVFDASSVERIATNLVENALKYASEAADPTIEVHAAANDGVITLSVRDHGPGIPASECERVFERFHRVARATDAHRPGTGLGLSLVRELAREHGGDAKVVGTEGGGATVVVTLRA